MTRGKIVGEWKKNNDEGGNYDEGREREVRAIVVPTEVDGQGLVTKKRESDNVL